MPGYTFIGYSVEKMCRLWVIFYCQTTVTYIHKHIHTRVCTHASERGVREKTSLEFVNLLIIKMYDGACKKRLSWGSSPPKED